MAQVQFCFDPRENLEFLEALLNVSWLQSAEQLCWQHGRQCVYSVLLKCMLIKKFYISNSMEESMKDNYGWFQK